MIRYGALCLLVLVLIGLQTSFFSQYPIAGVKPNLLLVLTILYTLFRGRKAGVWFAVLNGLFFDMVITRNLGTNLLLFSLIAYAVGSLEGKIYKDNLLVPMGTVLAGSISYYLLFFPLAIYAQIPLTISYFWKVLIIGTLYNVVLTPLFYWPFVVLVNRGWLKRTEV